MKRVGRPAEIDPETGETMAKSLVNVTIPTKLAEFLKRNNVNRSKLFTKVVTQMYHSEICPRCYTTDVMETSMGWFCQGYCSRHNNFCYKTKSCDQCNQVLSKYNLPIAMGDKNGPRIIGEKCCHAKD